jgi:hypothetical protein
MDEGIERDNTSEGGGLPTLPVPEIIDPVFAKTSQNARFLLSENERFGLVFVKTGSINSGTGLYLSTIQPSRRGFYRIHVCEGEDNWRQYI